MWCVVRSNVHLFRYIKQGFSRYIMYKYVTKQIICNKADKARNLAVFMEIIRRMGTLDITSYPTPSKLG